MTNPEKHFLQRAPHIQGDSQLIHPLVQPNANLQASHKNISSSPLPSPIVDLNSCSTGKVPSRRLSISLPEPIAAQLEQQATQEKISMGELVRRSIHKDIKPAPLQLPSPSIPTPTVPVVVSQPTLPKSLAVNSENQLGSQRLSVSVPKPLINDLEEIASSEGISMSEAARQAIKRDLYLQSLTRQGWEVSLKSPEGEQYNITPVIKGLR